MTQLVVPCARADRRRARVFHTVDVDLLNEKAGDRRERSEDGDEALQAPIEFALGGGDRHAPRGDEDERQGRGPHRERVQVFLVRVEYGHQHEEGRA